MVFAKKISQKKKKKKKKGNGIIFKYLNLYTVHATRLAYSFSLFCSFFVNIIKRSELFWLCVIFKSNIGRYRKSWKIQHLDTICYFLEKFHKIISRQNKTI